MPTKLELSCKDSPRMRAEDKLGWGFNKQGFYKEFKMGHIKIHAGDFQGSKTAIFSNGFFTFETAGSISGSLIESLDIASEENIKKMGGAIGWGIVGGIALGGIGAIAGLLAGGRKKDVTFVCRFKDGRRLLATTDSKTYIQIQAACFDTIAHAPLVTDPQHRQKQQPSTNTVSRFEKCTKCGKNVFRNVEQCPHCGKKDPTKPNQELVVSGSAIVWSILMAITTFVWYSSNSGETDKFILAFLLSWTLIGAIAFQTRLGGFVAIGGDLSPRW